MTYRIVYRFQNYEGVRGGVSIEEYQTKEDMNKAVVEFISGPLITTHNLGVLNMSRDILSPERKAVSKRFHIPICNIHWCIANVCIEILQKNTSASK